MAEKKSWSSKRPSVFTPFFRRFTDETARELSETKALYEKVRKAHLDSTWASPNARDAVVDVVVDAADDILDRMPAPVLRDALRQCLTEILDRESAIFATPEVDFEAPLSLKEAVDLRRFLRAKQHWLGHAERGTVLLVETLVLIYKTVCQRAPDIADDDSLLRVPLITLMDDPYFIVDGLLGTICDSEEIADAGLFAELTRHFYENLCAVSGFVPDTEHKKPFKTAADSDLSPVELVETYCANTPFKDLFLMPISLPLSPTIRFEHHWIVSPPGTGKSTTLQYLIHRDLDLVAKGHASVIVMESNRDLIKAIEGLKRFGEGGDLAGKLIAIDVEDVEWPIALNIFDVGLDRINAASPRDREALLNSATAMLDYVFRGLLGAELTSRQSTLFNFTIQLLLQIPSATLDTLIDLMQPKGLRQFAEHLQKLDPDARRFFELKFESKEFEATKSQVVDRLFAIKRIRTLARMFSAPRTKLDLFSEMGKGRVILINAAKSLLQEDGVEIFSRFFIAMILLAAEKRQLLPQSQRLPTYVYLDECHDVIRRDEKIPIILDQARKFRVALILAHQRLDQLTPPVLNALLGSTAIKFAAKLSDANASALARNMGTTAEFISSQRPYTYAAHVRGLTDSAISIQIPFTDFNRMERMSREEQEAVRDEMRRKYAVRQSHQASSQPPAAGAPPPPSPDRPASPKPPPETSDEDDTRPADKW